MMSISIEAQYKKALLKHSNIERELQVLPRGYISKKVIHGKTQYYLQRRVGKRVVGKYISDDEMESINNGLSRRAALSEELSGAKARISELEAAAKRECEGIAFSGFVVVAESEFSEILHCDSLHILMAGEAVSTHFVGLARVGPFASAKSAYSGEKKGRA